MTTIWSALALLADPGIPNPKPVAPPDSKEILDVLNNIKWLAGAGLMAAFFIGLLVWSGGRWVDHHRAGKVGLVMMMVACVGAVLYGTAYPLISHFATVTGN
jgi:CHASE2 domain-containing sensor protein